MSPVATDAICRIAALTLACLLIQGCTGTAKAPVVGKRVQPSEPAAVERRGQATNNAATLTNRRIPAFHNVSKGDTLYAVAWRYRLDHRELAQWNKIKSPFLIYPGDRLLLRRPPHQAPRATATPTSPKKRVTRPSKPKPAAQQRISWQWPADGKYRNVDSAIGRKGLEIRGDLGQTIRAAAPGTVVYSGSGLIGYGKLIIIKHDHVFLSAYAHNDNIVVQEGSSVSGGQKIAEMGNSNAKEVMLHFEIRRNGKPVPPLRYLPKSS